MPNDVVSSNQLSPLMEKLRAERKSAFELQERKHDDWTDNYELYRNRVKTNRLTQRQAVNIPLMKETLKTLLSRMDEKPEVDWKELGGDSVKEIIYQEVWEEHVKSDLLELKDIVDKKNVLLYGGSTKKLNIKKDGIKTDVLDSYDVGFDPLMSPFDIESARFIVQQNIFKTAREILANDRYSKEGKEALKVWLDSSEGITADQKNKEQWEKKMERLQAMGIDSGDFSLFAGGDRLINLTEHFTTVWDDKTKKFERRVIVYAEQSIELLNERLYDLIGVEFWPFIRWTEDPETTDIYPDSVADLVRTPNKVLNVWFSQMIENRTLKNFQMHWFLPTQGYMPQTYTPGPGVMLPAPPGEDVNKVIKPVEVSGLEDTLLAIDSLVKIVERGSGASGLDKGQPSKGEQTLGEVKILIGKTMERTISMAKFYQQAWSEYAWKWDKMLHANAPKLMKLYKAGKSGKLYPKKVFMPDWKSEVGYKATIRSSSEREAEDAKGIQKFLFVLSQFPNNPVLKKVAQKRMLEMLDVTSEEIRQITEAEKSTQQTTPMNTQINPMEQMQEIEGAMTPLTK